MLQRTVSMLLLAALILGTSLPVQSRRMRGDTEMAERLLRLRRHSHDATSAPLTSSSDQERTVQEEDVAAAQSGGYSYDHLIVPSFPGRYGQNTDADLENVHQRLPGDEDKPSGATGIPDQPSACVWAIVVCCTTGSTIVHNDCFEQLGCSGAWWDNPCVSDISLAALLSVHNFYKKESLK